MTHHLSAEHISIPFESPLRKNLMLSGNLRTIKPVHVTLPSAQMQRTHTGESHTYAHLMRQRCLYP